MNIVCVICSDLLSPSDDVFYTPCGHVFHFPCLTQWLERSKTCPQCRDKVSMHKIHRIYFNYSNNDTICDDDPVKLQAIIDGLKCTVMIKEKEIKQNEAAMAKAKKETSGLRVAYRKLEAEMSNKESAIFALQEQVKYFKQQFSDAENLKKEVTRLKKKIDDMQSINMLLHAPNDEVDELLDNTRDPNTLCAYISVLKRELTNGVAKRRELQSSLKKLQQDLTKVSMERNFYLEEHSNRLRLEEDLASSESERFALLKRLKELEGTAAPSVSQKSRNFAGRKAEKTKSIKKIAESNNVEESDDVEEDKLEEKEENASCEVKKVGENSSKKSTSFVDLSDSPIFRKKRSAQSSSRHSDVTVITSDSEKDSTDENSPYLRYKCMGFAGNLEKKRARIVTGSSRITFKAAKTRLKHLTDDCRESEDVCYDGFGGSSKPDIFPSRKKGVEPRKMKRPAPKKPKLDDGTNKKLGEFVGN